MKFLALIVLSCFYSSGSSQLMADPSLGMAQPLTMAHPMPVMSSVPIAQPVAVPVAHPVPVPVPVVHPMPVAAPLMAAPFIGFGRGAFGRFRSFRRRPFNRRRFFKRENTNSTELLEEEEFPVNTTFCNYSSDRKILSCNGMNTSFDCDVTQKLTGLEKLKLRLSRLEFVPAEADNLDVLRLFMPDSDFTVVEPLNKRKIVLSLFNSNETNIPGLMIKDAQCWNKVINLVKENKREDIQLALFL